MKKTWRPAIFVVPYFINEKNIPEFLLLKRKLHWVGWEFCKGKIEKGETQKEATIRELREETGIKIKEEEIFDYRLAGKYVYPKSFKERPDRIGQTYHLYSVKVNKKPKNISLDKLEHDGHKWVNFKEAIEKLTYSNQRECLRIVNKKLFLSKN